MKIKEKTFNIETGDEIIFERDETLQEIAAREAFGAQIADRQTQAAAKATARAAILDRLGLTEQEAALLLS